MLSDSYCLLLFAWRPYLIEKAPAALIHTQEYALRRAALVCVIRQLLVKSLKLRFRNLVYKILGKRLIHRTTRW